MTRGQDPASSKRYLFVDKALILRKIIEELLAIEYPDGRFLEVFPIARDDGICLQLEGRLTYARILEIAPSRIEHSINVGFVERADMDVLSQTAQSQLRILNRYSFGTAGEQKEDIGDFL